LPSVEPALPFLDRRTAGRTLAGALLRFAGSVDPIVLALPRGGLPVGYEVAKAIGAPLDLFLVRKLGVPGHEELALGAITLDGERIINEDVEREVALSPAQIEAVVANTRIELERRARLYRGERLFPPVTGRTVILVDDGLATGATMRAAVAALKKRMPAKLVVALPVGASSTCERLRGEVDELVCLAEVEPFYAVSVWYRDFPQVTDQGVRALLARPTLPIPVEIATSGRFLAGDLRIPDGAEGLVMFAHGGGSPRAAARNRYLAALLAEAGLATLLFDLLTPDEAHRERVSGELPFDVDLLGERLVGATEWAATSSLTRALRLGYFGASTGTAAALVAAAELPNIVCAIVSREGRPDLAEPALRHVLAPTLLLVAENDRRMVELNRTALAELRIESRLELIPGASQSFTEPGAVEAVAHRAADWFLRFLAPRPVVEEPRAH
jgi:putative phosphoribosyl transferase